MIPAGYMAKRVSKKPDWIKLGVVADIFSISSCCSENFSDYVRFWRHNGWWLFDSPDIINELAKEDGLDLSGTRFFYYEIYEQEYVEETKDWVKIRPEESFVTQVHIPATKALAGYDVASFYAKSSPECSPLSCNGLADEIAVNTHCLFDAFDQAQQALESGLFLNSEPGPYRIFAVYTL